MSEHLDRALLAPGSEASDVDRQRVLDHVRSCSECRDQWVGADPSRVFALLAVDSVPEAALDRLTACIDAELERESTARRRRGLAAGGLSLAASVVLAVILGGGLTRRPESSGTPFGGLEPVELPVAEIQLLASPGEAQVLDLSVGGTSVVMIFDRDLDI